MLSLGRCEAPRDAPASDRADHDRRSGGGTALCACCQFTDVPLRRYTVLDMQAMALPAAVEHRQGGDRRAAQLTDRISRESSGLPNPKITNEVSAELLRGRGGRPLAECRLLAVADRDKGLIHYDGDLYDAALTLLLNAVGPTLQVKAPPNHDAETEPSGLASVGWKGPLVHAIAVVGTVIASRCSSAVADALIVANALPYFAYLSIRDGLLHPRDVELDELENLQNVVDDKLRAICEEAGIRFRMKREKTSIDAGPMLQAQVVWDEQHLPDNHPMVDPLMYLPESRSIWVKASAAHKVRPQLTLGQQISSFESYSGGATEIYHRD